jgi:iron complex outermembrane receptor protein
MQDMYDFLEGMIVWSQFTERLVIGEKVMKKERRRIVSADVMIVVFALELIINFFSAPFAAAQDRNSKQESAQVEKAQESCELETMTVTAQKREENIQEVPMSITALSDVQIEDAGIKKLEDLGFYTPNMLAGSSGGRSEPSPIIRGMYNRMSVNPTVGMYVDGVAYSRAQAYDLDLVDIERIEVLKGPQGTLFGRNTEAGVINIVTKKPGNIWKGKISADYGNYNTQDYSFAVSGPLVQDTLSFGISGRRYLSDGYFENDYLGTDDAERSDDTSGRATLRWTPTEAWDVILNVGSARYENGFYTFTPSENISHSINLDFEGRAENDSDNQSLSLDYDGGWFRFTSITAHRTGDYSPQFDMDSTSFDYYRTYYRQEQAQLSQEIRFASPDDSKGVKWLIGVYYLDEDFDVDTTYDYRQGVPEYGLPAYQSSMNTKLNTQNYAVFGQATYTFWEKLGLTAGLRYENDKKDFKGLQFDDPDVMWTGTTTVENDKSLEEWLPKFAVDYRFTQDFMGYVSVAKGYTSGGFNNLDANVLGIPYDPEFSWNYEAGVKTAWLNNKLILNFAAFYIDWTDKQVLLPTGAVSSIYKNAAEATVKGFEVEALARPIRGLEVVGSFGYLDSEYDTFTEPIFDSDTGAQIGEKDYEGKQLEYTPEFSYNLAVQYRYPLSHSGALFSRIELHGVGDYYWNLDNTQKQSSYELVNARLGYEGEFKGYGFCLYLWAKNIFDKTYGTAAYGSDALGYSARAGDPQTFGVTLTAWF